MINHKSNLVHQLKASSGCLYWKNTYEYFLPTDNFKIGKKHL